MCLLIVSKSGNFCLLYSIAYVFVILGPSVLAGLAQEGVGSVRLIINGAGAEILLEKWHLASFSDHLDFSVTLIPICCLEGGIWKTVAQALSLGCYSL